MKKWILIISLTILSCASIVISWIAPFYLIWSIIFTVCSSLSYIFYLVTTLLNHKWRKLALVLNITVICIVAIFTVFYYTGLLSHFASLEDARMWFDSFGAWAWIVFFLIQIAQVVILPIPAQITTIAGVLIFGAWKTFVISAVAIISGSLICFAIGRHLGVKVAYKIASKETVDKYRNLLTKKGKILLPVMFLFPAFPDDLLCFIAGTTKMTWKYFICITLLTRLIAVACICWFGSGELIPFHGWGIPVWIVIGIAMIFILYFLFKYQEQVENWIIKTFTKSGKENSLQEDKTKTEQKLNEEMEQDNKQDYVNFQDASKTKNDYVNFENFENSKGIADVDNDNNSQIKK